MSRKTGRSDAKNARRRQRYAQDLDCRAKNNARCRAYYQAHRQEIIERARAYHQAHTKEGNERTRAYYEAHKQEINEQSRAYRHDHKDDRQRLLRRLTRYGISPAEYDALLAKQNGACAICRRRPKGRLCVDHCHVTGRIRGLLCHSCNLALGYLRDDQASLIAAVAYLGALPRDGPGSAAQRALSVRAVLPRGPKRRAVLIQPHLPIGLDAAPRT
jgi:Recombination endonuclease VII